MKNNDKQFRFVPFGIFGSIAVGIAMFVAGGVTNNFGLSVGGAIVIVAGIVITVTITVVIAVKKAAIDWKNLSETNGSADRTYDDDDDDDEYTYPSDKELTGILDSENPRKTVEDILSREDALTDIMYKYDMEDLVHEYYTESEKIWDKYKGEFWDENLDELETVINSYYEKIKAKKVLKSTVSEQEDSKIAQNTKKTDELTSAVEPEKQKIEEQKSATENIEKSENNAKEPDEKTVDAPPENIKAPEPSEPSDRTPKQRKPAVGYKPMKSRTDKNDGEQ